MKGLLLARIALTGWLLLAWIPSTAAADAWNKKTYVTFGEPVEVPGGMLPPGKYVFQLADSPSNRHIVQILSADQKQVRATILAISSFRVQVADKTALMFYEMPGGRPQALKSWYYPGDSYGQRFAYPKTRATDIARLTGQHVPIAPEKKEGTEALAAPDQRAAEAASAAKPSPSRNPVRAADPVTAEPGTVAAKDAAPPSKTGDLPLAGLIGASTVLAAAGLRILSKRFV